MGTYPILTPSQASLMQSPRSQGFTLAELMVTIGISIILLGMGVPSFTSYIANSKIRSASTDLSFAITLARSEAIKRNSTVVMTPASSGWQNGWTVKAGSATLAQQNAYSSITISGPDTLTYGNDGRLTGTTAPTFQISGSSSATSRCVSVNLSGLPSSKTGSCS